MGDAADDMNMRWAATGSEHGEYSSRPILPYDYARCVTQGCPLEKSCMRKTPGRETYQTCFGPDPSDICKDYINEDEWK